MARKSHVRVIVTSAVVAVAVAGGGVAWATTRSSGPTYRFASASRATVHQTVTEVGTIASADQATVAFPVSGTVASVKVKVGQRVAAGRTVATLETASLESSIESAKSTVASAKQRLVSDQDGQTSTTTTSSTSQPVGNASSSGALTTNSVSDVALVAAAPSASATARPSGAPTGGGSGGASGGGSGGGSGGTSVAKAKAAVSPAQHQVTAAQAKVDGLLTTLSADMKNSATACDNLSTAITTSYAADGTVSGTVGDSSDGLAVTLTGTDANDAPITMTTTVAGGAFHFNGLPGAKAYQVTIGNQKSGVTFVDSCTAALNTGQTDERDVAQATKALTTAIDQLDDAVTKYLDAVQAADSSTDGSPSGGTDSSAPTSRPSSGAGNVSRPSGGAATSGSTATSGGTGTRTGGTGSTTGSGATTMTTTITAEQIAADQKSIDAAKAELAVARQNRAEAVLATPISGTVAAVAISSGSSVSAGSSTSTITVIGYGQKKITTTVGVADIDLVKQGQPVAVTVDGVSTTLSGRVTLIGVLNTSGTSGTTTTYPVTVLLDKTSRTLYDGAGATVAIDVGTKQNALTVPTSAVHLSAIGSTVSVYSDGKVTTTRVQTGVRGVGSTEITSGLAAGQKVVIAVVSAAIPSSNSNTNNRGGASTLLGGTAGGGAARFAGGAGGPPGGR